MDKILTIRVRIQKQNVLESVNKKIPVPQVSPKARKNNTVRQAYLKSIAEYHGR